MAAAMATLPLHCNICPKKPSFSDVSHLLTHIASKGHLSHYYKVKVRSGQDFAAKVMIDEYDQWYANHSVEQLMSDRMHLKDRKRPRLRAQVLSTNIPHISQVSQSRSSALDPLLSTLSMGDVSYQQHLSTTPYSSYPSWTNGASRTELKHSKPPLALWRTRRPRSVVSVLLDYPISSPGSAPFHFKQGPGIAPQAKMWTRNASVQMNDGDDGGSEATKLKGVYWPGMNIFDAATPDMRRKRNQKKDTSVAIQLERHSLYVEPTEMIFTPLGSLKKQRVISGHADFDSSPDKLSPPTPKPRRRQLGRHPLARKDVNTSSLHTRIASTPPFPGYGPVDNSNHTSRASQPLRKQKREFEVFQDDNRQIWDNPSTMRLLTSGFRPASQSGSQERPLPPTLVDINTGAVYHNNLFTEAFEAFQPSFYGMPYYGHGYYGQSSVESSGIFHNQQINLPVQSGGQNALKVENIDDGHTVSAHSDD